MHSRNTQYLKFQTRFLNIYNCVYKTPFDKFGLNYIIIITGVLVGTLCSRTLNYPSRLDVSTELSDYQTCSLLLVNG